MYLLAVFLVTTGNGFQVARVTGGWTCYERIPTTHPPYSGETRSIVVMVLERRYGPRRLRVDDDEWTGRLTTGELKYY